MNGREIRVAELFAGIGGFRLGLEQADHNEYAPIRQKPEPQDCQQGRQWSTTKPTVQLRNRDKPTFRVVWANEWDKSACQIYRKNFGEKELCEGDLTKVEATDIPDIDLLVGGFPCQPFSLAGERKGFSDKRGNLFFEIARILESKRPQTILLENVRGLLSAQNGFCFYSILSRLDELGYNVEWKVLNTKNWLPQNRERIFIVGHNREGRERGSQVFPFSSYDEEDYSEGESVGTLQGGGHSGGLHSNMTAITNTVRSGGRGSSDRHSWGVVLLDNFGGNIKKRIKENGIAWTLGGSKTGILQIKRTRANGNDTVRAYDNEVPTLTSQMETGGNNVPIITEEKEGRRLTEIECERLQGFPDNWTKGVSSTQRYKMLGNAVSVPVIQYIGGLILNA
jgi:DNA (cytosine-5)-methyltransferase 1